MYKFKIITMMVQLKIKWNILFDSTLWNSLQL